MSQTPDQHHELAAHRPVMQGSEAGPEANSLRRAITDLHIWRGRIMPERDWYPQRLQLTFVTVGTINRLAKQNEMSKQTLGAALGNALPMTWSRDVSARIQGVDIISEYKQGVNAVAVRVGGLVVDAEQDAMVKVLAPFGYDRAAPPHIMVAGLPSHDEMVDRFAQTLEDLIGQTVALEPGSLTT